MDLKDKLKYYSSEAKVNHSEKEKHPEEIALKLQGYVIEPHSLPVIKIEKTIPYQYIDPRITTTNNSTVYLPLLTKKKFSDPINTENILVFDLETTGLAGGTGTYPFLIGFGIFEKSDFRIFQYFLPDFGREINAYLDIKTLSSKLKILLTYNGKSFDYPLIRNRFILNRIDNPFHNYVHLDLLHPSRRLWKSSLPSCSLENVEKHIFSFSRWKDIDGSMIPQAYFTYIQTGDLSDIKRIINHNQQDIISLCRLLFHMHHLENTTDTASSSELEIVSMFNLAVKTSDVYRIGPMIKSFTQNETNLPIKSLKNYSLLLKRQKKWGEALEIWQSLIERGEEILFSCEEIAKYYEHRHINIEKAIAYTNRAVDFINIVDELNGDDSLPEFRTNFNRRLIRLQAKLDRNK